MLYLLIGIEHFKLQSGFIDTLFTFYAPVLLLLSTLTTFKLLRMEFNQKYYNYSMKNIPIPSEKTYKMALLEKVELLTKRMRWKAHLFENSDLRHSNLLHYIFKRRKSSPQHKELIELENDLVKLMQNVKLKHFSNDFQDHMKSDMESIKRSKNNYVFADKTNIIYETNIKNYNKLLIDNISKTYIKNWIQRYLRP